jgi:hypothetical protein
MQKFLLFIVAVAVLALAASGLGSADELAAGSAKTDIDVVLGSEHASFGAHTTGGPDCEATGHIVYKNTATGDEFAAKITRLITNQLPEAPEVFFAGPVTKAEQGTVNVGDFVYFHASDSQQPGGTGDTFEFVASISFDPTCKPPAAGLPITSGNIVIKTGL